MGLSNDLISQFVKITKDNTEVKGDNTVYGTAMEYNGGMYVKIDGSDRLTPVTTTANLKPGDRVTVIIKNHTATVTGNVTSPSASHKDLEDVSNKLDDACNQISEFEIVIAGKVNTKEFEAEKARIDSLQADNVEVKKKLTANEAEIENLKADNLEVNKKLTANEAEIEDLKAKKLDAEIADIKYATVENLDATNANVHNLEATYGEFKDLATEKFAANEADIKKLQTDKLNANEADLKYATVENLKATNANVERLESEQGDFKKLTAEKFEANEADIEKLKTDKLDATSADLKYANIDFSNIGKAAIEHFYATSGIIKDLVIGDTSITGVLVGVTIMGDLIQGGTVKADKLVVKGEDGLYYKLNTEGMKTEVDQNECNSLNGSIITAKSITATKISVDDLVAFDATIGGFHISEDAIYSGVKTSVDNTTSGLFLGSDGQMALGDKDSYLKYYKDQNGNWKLEVTADTVRFGSSKKTVEETISDIRDDIDNLDIGGRNLFLKSAMSISSNDLVGVNDSNWNNAIRYYNGNKSMHSFSPQQGSIAYIDSINLNGANGNVGLCFARYAKDLLTVGQTYTISFYAKCNDISIPIWIGLSYQNTSGKKIWRGGANPRYLSKADTWEKMTLTFVLKDADLEYILYSFGATAKNISSDIILQVKEPKFERGNKSTDWTPAPEDANYAIGDLKDSYQKDIDSLRDEITTLLRIESSRGTVFKTDRISTVLSVVIYHGTQRITDSTTMKSVFGNSAYLQWKWQHIDDDDYGIMSSADTRFGDNGFTFTLSPDDIDTKVTFMCELIT